MKVAQLTPSFSMVAGTVNSADVWIYAHSFGPKETPWVAIIMGKDVGSEPLVLAQCRYREDAEAILLHHAEEHEATREREAAQSAGQQ